MQIQRNLGIFDVIIRLFLTIAIAIIATATQQLWLGIVACVMFISALSTYCPVYGMFGFKTCNESEEH